MLVPYVIRQGDYLTKLALLNGFRADEVWNDPRNAAIRAARQDMDVLLPGDVVHVPARRPEPLPLQVGASNAYVGRVDEVPVRFTLRFGGKPAAGEPYEVRGLPAPISDCADGDGLISFAVPATVVRVDVFLPKRNEIVPVLVGHLDPETTRSGAAGRLANLGYLGIYAPDGATAGDEALAWALTRFQADHAGDHGLSPTGELDAATGAALRAVHGS